MILLVKIAVGFEEVESSIILKEIKITNEEMIKVLIYEIRQIKIGNNNDNTKNNKNNLEQKINGVEEKAKNSLSTEKERKENENEAKINLLIKKNEELEEKINMLIKKNEESDLKIFTINEENKKLKKTIDKYRDYLDKKIKKEKEENKYFNKLNNNIEFQDNPLNLKLNKILTNNNSCGGWLFNFDIYTSLKDNIEYLVYNNKINFNLKIMRIKDKSNITSLKGHNTYTTVIRYYSKDNKEEYILSCDENKLVIIWDIWDIQNYNKKYIIQSKYSGYIYDALLLFNIFNNNYILLSSYDNEFSELYEFKENTKFIKNIFGTNEHKTLFLIPWIFNNKYYIIECCNNKISINNLLENECYTNLSMKPEHFHPCGFLYKDNYLCVSDNNNQIIRVWDLINKNIYKQINYDINRGYEILSWNKSYSILATKGCFVIFDIEEGKIIKRIHSDKSNHYLQGIKKIKISDIGECLICADSDNCIKLYSL